MTAATLDKDEEEFFRSPFISICLTIGPAVGFVAWIGYEWLLNSRPSKAYPVALLTDGGAWLWAYLLGLHFAVPAVVIFVVIGLVFKCVGFPSMLASAALAPIVVAGFFYIQGSMRIPSERLFTGYLNFLVPSIAAMTACWVLAGTIRAMRAPR